MSVVVTNFNYARYLAEAIESALAQTHSDVEVIVVDDGSTDDSRTVIEQYRGQADLVFKANGGQASAINAGFARASGKAVVFLDADDTLGSETAASVEAAFEETPEAAQVHWRLAVVDDAGVPTGAFIPPASLTLPVGDLLDRLRDHPDDIPHAPCSGNAFAGRALERLLPMPEEDFRVLADVYLLNLAPMFGPVRRLSGTGGRYRVHGANRHFRSTLDAGRVRATLRVSASTHSHMARLAGDLGVSGFPATGIGDRSLVFLSHRLVSLRLDAEHHPFPEDTRARLAVRGIAAARRRKDLAFGMRLLYTAWFAVAAVAPRSLARRLAEAMVHQERRGPLGRIVERLRGRT